MNTILQIKMKPVDIKCSTYIDFGVKNNEKDSKFTVGYHERISKCKSIFAKVYAVNWSKNSSCD